METFKSKKLLFDYLKIFHNKNKSIGFVPTMGCLHQGHLSLIEKAAIENDLVVCSIFVNPTQFNDPQDFKKYPRNFEEDMQKLSKVKCDVIFSPSEEEIYPEGLVKETYDLNGLDKVMEGKYRPGHFNGVVTVVKKLFNIIGPCNAYFGEKDYQQLVIIKYITQKLGLQVNIIPCPTVREVDGLAMSSRNLLLSPTERLNAPLIYKTLMFIKNNFNNYSSFYDLKQVAEEKINSNPYFKLDYLEIAHKDTLLPIDTISNRSLLRAFIAAYVGQIRLIDNISLA
ncbi:MAG TPA: pantoate--beta-alanine ligase [Bacteroidales bacterium]|nr:pantoate--beta-alanine ligase [Bacteroidales bacterium]